MWREFVASMVANLINATGKLKRRLQTTDLLGDADRRRIAKRMVDAASEDRRES